jgi:hypothetical protein
MVDYPTFMFENKKQTAKADAMIKEKNKKPSIFLPGFFETFIGNTIFLYHEAPLRARTKRSFVVQNEAELRGTKRSGASWYISIKPRQIKRVDNRQ